MRLDAAALPGPLGRWAAALVPLPAERRQGRFAAPKRQGAWGRPKGLRRWTQRGILSAGRRQTTGHCPRRQTARYGGHHAPTGAATGSKPPMSPPASGSPQKSRHGYTACRCSRSQHVAQRREASDSQHAAQAYTARGQLHSVVSVVTSLHPTQGPSTCFMVTAPLQSGPAGQRPRPTPRTSGRGYCPVYLQTHRHDHGKQPRTVRRLHRDRALAFVVRKLQVHPRGIRQPLKCFREVPDLESADRHHAFNR